MLYFIAVWFYTFFFFLLFICFCCLNILIEAEIQQQLAVTEEKENISSEKILTLSSKIKALETQNSSMRQEKCQLSAQLEMEKSKREMLEDSQNK